MKVVIETIPHESQRYPTVGDWYYEEDGTLRIKVSELSDWRYVTLVALHELCEERMCKQDGVTQAQVDAFDKQFEANRPEGNLDEPGDDTEAPYRKQHGIATGIERIMAAELGVDWNKYAAELESLP